jgi:hypothetical protein
MKLKLSRRTGMIIKLALAPLPVPIHEIRPGLMVAEVMGTGTLEARVKTTISPRIQERLAEVLARLRWKRRKLPWPRSWSATISSSEIALGSTGITTQRKGISIMKKTSLTKSAAYVTILVSLLWFTPVRIFAHCDGMDGPVVKAAQKALAETNVNLVLIWVQQDDEAQIKQAFEKTLAVRKLNPEARELADMYFFETLVRIHRAGEGAPYTGLKPAGRDLGPAIPAGDKALATGDIEAVVKLLAEEMEHGVREHFQEALAKKKFDKNNVEAGREFVRAYAEYMEYVEGIHQAASSAAHGLPSLAEESVKHARPHQD